MNIYFCRHKLEWQGFFVVAGTRSKAKAYFANEECCDFIDVRTNIIKRGVSDKFYGYLNEDELNELGIEFEESEY